jgi:hypothetical protein
MAPLDGFSFQSGNGVGSIFGGADPVRVVGDCGIASLLLVIMIQFVRSKKRVI